MYISAGTMLATGGRDGSMKVWDAITGVGLAEVIGAHSDSIRGMACDSNGLSLVTASADMSVKLWQQVLPTLPYSIPYPPSPYPTPPPQPLQSARPPPLPLRSSLASLRLENGDPDDPPSDDEAASVSASAAALVANHGLFSAQSKRSLALAFDTSTDAEDDAELVPHAANDSPVTAAGTLGALSPIAGSNPVSRSRSASKRKNSNGLNHRLSASRAAGSKQSPSVLSSGSTPQPASERSGASYDSSFIDSPTGLPGAAAAAAAVSASSAAGRAATACLADPSSPHASAASSDGQRLCIDCGENWMFESRDREFFAAKGFHVPRRCGKCRRLKKMDVGALVSKESGSPRSVSYSLQSLGEGLVGESDSQNGGTAGTGQRNLFRGTNLHGIGFIYEGGVNAVGRQEGFGTQVASAARASPHNFTITFASLTRPFQTWDTNHSYKGEWRGGRKEGHGIYTWPDGATYEGKYKKGRRHGSGLQTMSDGAV